MAWILGIAALGIMILIAVDQRSRKASQKEIANLVRRYRIPGESWQSLAEQMKDKKSEDAIQCSLWEEEGVLKLFCATNEVYGLNRETVAFRVTVEQEPDSVVLILEAPEPLFKWGKSAVCNLSSRLDEYMVRKLSGMVL